MSYSVLIVTDNETLSRSICGYLDCCLGNGGKLEFGVYGKSGLDGDFYRRADLLIFGLFGRDDDGYRAEGLLTALKRAENGRRVLVVSGCAVAARLNCDWYWDLGAQEPLCERVTRLLTMPPAPASVFKPVEDEFDSYCREAVDRHHRTMRQG